MADDLKKLMQEKRKQRLLQTQIPKNSKIVDGQLLCLECNQTNQTIADFQKHLSSQKHKEALQQNRKVDIQRLENEAYREVIKKPQKLTKEQIERINKEVDQEFAEVETNIEKQINTIPNDFFDSLEEEAKIIQQLEKEKQLLQEPQQEIKQENELDIDSIQKLRDRITNRKQQQKIDQEFNFEDENFLDIHWKSKSNQ